MKLLLVNIPGQPSQKTQEIILKVWTKRGNLRGTDTFLFLGCQDFARLIVTFSLQIVSDAAGQGVAITGNNTFNNWNWPNAVIFAATVITTIGKYLLCQPSYQELSVGSTVFVLSHFCVKVATE